MGQKTNTIQINGKRYDARTGDLLDAPLQTHAPHSQAAPKSGPAHHGGRQPAKASVRHQPQKSHTLVRHAVKKPASVKKIRVTGHTDEAVIKQTAGVIVSKPARSIDHNKASKARRIAKNGMITHFAPISASAMPAYEAPAFNPAPLTFDPPPAVKSKKAGGRPKTTADILDLALHHATSHEQSPVEPRHHRKRHTKTAALAGTALLLLAFVGWQELPNARLQLASAKAGFNVSQPDYVPSGYSLNRLQYGQGTAAISFHSNSDDRHYTIVQKSTAWDSKALEDKFVTPMAVSYRVVHSADKTVYIYADNNSTWIENGIWYVVQSDGSLSQSQLIDLANSI